MSDDAEETVELQLLPNKKPHVSWSEIKVWIECSYRHKLIYVDGLDNSKPSPILYFGTACHAACESFFNTRVMDPMIACAIIEKAFDDHKGEEGFTTKEKELMLVQAPSILVEVPSFYDKEFPGWQPVKAEHKIYMPISDSRREHAFKGFIDSVILVPNPKGEHLAPLTWILDYKTTNSYWSHEKKSDPKILGQLVSYKNYWMAEHGIKNMLSVRCGFVLLKRQGKTGERCELLTVSAGDKTITKTLKVINNCVTSMKRGVALKNRESCKYCDFKGTIHCT